MARSSLLPVPLLALLALAGCGGGGGGGGGGGHTSTVSTPAYVNHTVTGQCANDDLGFYLGADPDPESPTTATAHPKLKWDVMNGFSSTKSDIAWRVLKDGAPFASGTVSSIAAFSWADLSVEVTGGTAGTHTYRIEIDPANSVSESNEHNNWVEVVYTISPAAPS